MGDALALRAARRRIARGMITSIHGSGGLWHETALLSAARLWNRGYRTFNGLNTIDTPHLLRATAQRVATRNDTVCMISCFVRVDRHTCSHTVPTNAGKKPRKNPAMMSLLCATRLAQPMDIGRIRRVTDAWRYRRSRAQWRGYG